LLLLILHVEQVGWPGTEKIILALQNALLNKSRVLNSKCPEHFSGEGYENRRVLFKPGHKKQPKSKV
jgi:hypothetical protein